MRLLHVKDLRLEEFFDNEIPQCAILSHRWGPEEVSYQDLQAGHKKAGAGYNKILECCKYAAADVQTFDVRDELDHVTPSGIQEWRDLYSHDWVWVYTLDWLWMDTCCIDKSSSSELSEAINSMSRYYAKSRACYAYLSDVTKRDDIGQTLTELRNSQWFKRGWTLQELLEPDDLVFLDQTWTTLGTRSDFLADVAKATGITEEQLETSSSDEAYQSSVSVAERLSWAAHRETTRIKDQTYCLLGVLGINMSLLYGERTAAFKRLQLEIIRSSNDESVFVWQSGLKGRAGLIADSPMKFGSKFSTQKGEFSKITNLSRPPYSITNQGLQLHVPARLAQRSSFLLPLNCQHYEGDVLKGVYAIPIEREDSSGAWRRSSPQYYPKGVPSDGTVYYLDKMRYSGLFVAPTSWVWSREDLAKEGSEIIYARIS